MTMTVSDFGLTCGILPKGASNAITDVPGVRVGHCTLRNGDINTGVTAILPHGGNMFRNKVTAASHVINGFGKTVGLTQVQELGTIETPILLTNTLSVGTCATALIRDAIRLNPDIGRSTGTVNPVVGECNDGPLNDIQALAISEEHALAALADAHQGAVEQGNVGAGTGMSCFGFKGGIGSASRKIALGGEHHLGVLVLSNFGKPGDLVLPDGRRPDPGQPDQAERGSIMIVLATDVPLEHRQLERVARRAGAGIARLGSFWGHGSGDIAIAFNTGNMVDHDEARDLVPLLTLNEARIDILFRAAVEATQEAVLNSMLSAQAFMGRAGTRRTSLADWLRDQAEKR
ncbi:P1 family peptidase [Mesorhizobium sp. CO1-1-8]|uniref:DmpA family aminopeptidase n=1 Tax=Mesorhizobium sp. CO1-1-8 TaxID=2876631 RepID=UPI001CD148F1|nr:P1 family peptidase [Mesorhizobium sp. CO1-1-8]MBZ9777067.1 P1 family peptidase [Mesorhizobium sp. CO1-1-8]